MPDRYAALFFFSRGKSALYFADPALYFHPALRYNKDIQRNSGEVQHMTPRERILAIKLLEKQERNPDYAKRIGVQVSIKKTDPTHRN